MSIKSKYYFWVSCDHPVGRPFSSGCEGRCPGEGDDYAAWGAALDAKQYAEDSGWQQRGDLWFCPEHAIEEEDS